MLFPAELAQGIKCPSYVTHANYLNCFFQHESIYIPKDILSCSTGRPRDFKIITQCLNIFEFCFFLNRFESTILSSFPGFMLVHIVPNLSECSIQLYEEIPRGSPAIHLLLPDNDYMARIIWMVHMFKLCQVTIPIKFIQM